MKASLETSFESDMLVLKGNVEAPNIPRYINASFGNRMPEKLEQAIKNQYCLSCSQNGMCPTVNAASYGSTWVDRKNNSVTTSLFVDINNRMFDPEQAECMDASSIELLEPIFQAGN